MENNGKEYGWILYVPCRLGDTIYKIVQKQYHTPDMPSPWFAYVKKCTLTKKNLYDLAMGYGETSFLSEEQAFEALKKVKLEMQTK